MSAGALHLTRLTLRRFRSHAQFELETDARPVAIHGPNGAGKTNILEAISLLSPGRGLRGAGAEEMAGRPDPIGWSVSARAEALGGPSEIAVSVDLRDGARRSVVIDETQARQTNLGEKLRILWLTPAMDRLWMEGASERRRFLDRTVLSFDPAHGDRAAAYERAMRERNRLLKEPSPDPRWLDALETRMAESGAALAEARRRAVDRLMAAQRDAETAFPTATLSIIDDIGDDALALARRLRDTRPRDAAAGRSLTGPHRSDLGALFPDGVEARLCSTGEQKALLISLILATARAVRAEISAAPILLLDEIAAHLDAGRRAALYDEISALGAQAWMTGTGLELFAELGERARVLSL